MTAPTPPRCAEWLDEEHSLSDGRPVFVRCARRAGHDPRAEPHTHGRFEWGSNVWNEQLSPEMMSEITRLTDDLDGGES